MVGGASAVTAGWSNRRAGAMDKEGQFAEALL